MAQKTKKNSTTELVAEVINKALQRAVAAPTVDEMNLYLNAAFAAVNIKRNLE
jgi:hypothetical protein